MKPKSSLRWLGFAFMATLLLALAVASTAAARLDPLDGSGVPTAIYAPYTVADEPYAPYTAGPVVAEVEPYAPYTAGPVVAEVEPYAPYTVEEEPYAPYEAGPVVHESDAYAPYEAGPVIH